MKLSVTHFWNHLKASYAAEGQWITKGDAYYAAPLLEMSDAERRELVASCSAVGFEAVLEPANLSGGALRIRCRDVHKAKDAIDKVNAGVEAKEASVAKMKKGKR